VRHHHAARRDVAREVAGGGTDGDTTYGLYYTRITPSRVAMGRESMAAFEAAFDRLNDDHREVITLTRIVGLSHAEAAQEMGRSEDAVRVLLQRALARLAWFLSREAGS
jgi:RNA polymerase sigma-70 factor (ECF subfamily)